MRLFLLTFILSFFLAPSSVFAVGELSVSPMIIHEKAEARDILRESITVKNVSREKQNVYTFINNITVGQNGGIESFSDISTADKETSLANWIQIPRGVIELSAGEEKKIDFTIPVNLNAKAGSYYASVSFIPGSKRDEAEKLLKGSASSIVNVEVTEKVNTELQSKGFTTDSVFYTGKTVGFTYTLENIGSTAIIPQGEIIFYNRKGQEVGSQVLNQERVSLPPNSRHEFNVTFDSTFSFGRYKAFLNVTYGDVQKYSLTDTTFFFMVPWVEILLIFLGLIVGVIILAHYIHKRYLSHHPHQQSHTREPIRKGEKIEKGAILDLRSKKDNP